jgi:hypothetical protein
MGSRPLALMHRQLTRPFLPGSSRRHSCWPANSSRNVSLGSCPVRPFTWPDLRRKLSMSDRERPLVAGVDGPLMARRSGSLISPGLGFLPPSGDLPETASRGVSCGSRKGRRLAAAGRMRRGRNPGRKPRPRGTAEGTALPVLPVARSYGQPPVSTESSPSWPWSPNQ